MRMMVLLGALLLALPVHAQDMPPRGVLETAVTEVIRPAMAAFRSEAENFEASATNLCAQPTAEALEAARDAFSTLVRAYGEIEFIRVGPLVEENRAERLLFWPDRKGIGLRQVQAILSSEDADATTPAGLQAKSVAVQGLGALEFVLFGTGAEQLGTAEGDFRCRFGAAIGANISTIADDLVAGWSAPGGIADHLMAPQPDYSDYRNETEALEELVGLVSQGVEIIRDQRINPFVGREGVPAKPKQALLWRSNLTMALIEADIAGLRRLIAGSGVTSDHASLGRTIDFEFGNAVRAVDLVTSPVEDAVADPKQAQALGYLVVVTRSLQTLVGEQLAAALGLSVGFSSLDGD
jgi:uncharacterized protein